MSSLIISLQENAFEFLLWISDGIRKKCVFQAFGEYRHPSALTRPLLSVPAVPDDSLTCPGPIPRALALAEPLPRGSL